MGASLAGTHHRAGENYERVPRIVLRAHGRYIRLPKFLIDLLALVMSSHGHAHVFVGGRGERCNGAAPSAARGGRPWRGRRCRRRVG